jgi:ABC-type phosphate transport system substrate-binding protein
MRTTLRGGGVLAVAALVVSGLATAPTASADPSFTPDADDIVGVGSDTTEFVMNKLAAGFNARAIGGTQQMASFNATGTSTIVPRSGASAIPRPNGSSAGIDALQAESDLSFARSSRGPNPTGDEGLLFFPYAKDTLGYVFSKPGSHVRKDLGANQLKAIYTCQKTNWKAFGMPAGHIHARVPQAGSGTRSFFIASIGIDETQLQDAIAQPNRQCSVIEVQEHDPTAVIGDKNAIAPFSLARFTILRKAVKTTIGYAAQAKFNVKRNVYNVIRSADVAALGQYFNADSWICTKKPAKEIIANQGFTRLPTGQCGVPIVA